MEEWNEYGELKDNIGGPQAAASTPTPSAVNTPSKPPNTNTASEPSLSTQTPPEAPLSKSSETPLTTAMRQAAQEAATKAGNSKTKAKENPPEPSEVSSETLSRLDNSAPTGMPPPSGTTDADSAKAPETVDSSAESKADEVPQTSETAARSNTSLSFGKEGGPGGTYTKHRGSNVGLASPEEIREIENRQAIAEEDEVDDESKDGPGEEVQNPKGVRTEDATAATDKAQDLPGSRTQNQPAASAGNVEESVAD